MERKKRRETERERRGRERERWGEYERDIYMGEWVVKERGRVLKREREREREIEIDR